MSWEDKNPLYIRDLRNILIFISLNKNIKTKCCAVGEQSIFMACVHAWL